MSDEKDSPMSPSAILATLDSISQAIDAMTAVVGELRNYLDEHWEPVEVSRVALEPEEFEAVESSAQARTLH